MSETTKLTGKDLSEKALAAMLANPSITRKELATICGYQGTKTGIQEFSEAYLVASGLLPADPVTRQAEDKDIFRINRTGMACVRKSWLAKINVAPGERVKFFYNKAEGRIEISKLPDETPAIKATPELVQEPPASTPVISEHPSLIPVTYSVAPAEVPAPVEVVMPEPTPVEVKLPDPTPVLEVDVVSFDLTSDQVIDRDPVIAGSDSVAYGQE